MTDERRYSDEEVGEILDLAADTKGGSGAPVGSGLTLRELKEIGAEVGIEPDRIAEAAKSLERRRTSAPARTLLGAPLTVERVVDLPRAPTPLEWQRLVAELRETFRAQGQVTAQEGFFGWRNSNLHAYVEPTESGHRLRMGTLKGSAIAQSRAGGMLLAIALVLLVGMLLQGDLALRSIFGPLFLTAMGGGLLGSSVLSLPRWARERAEQMEYIADRALAMLASGPTEGEGPAAASDAGRPGVADRREGPDVAEHAEGPGVGDGRS